MHASVVICTYNRSHRILETLKSLEKLTIPQGWRWDLIVVDNNSSDDTQAAVNSFLATTSIEARCVFEASQGLSIARNRGVKEAKGEIIAFSDDDMLFDPRWLDAIISVFDNYPCICVAGRIIPQWPAEKPKWLIENGPYRMMTFDGRFDLGDRVKETKEYPFGGNMAFRKSAFDKYGYFRTDLGRTGNRLMAKEETEFCERLLNAGETIFYSPQATVHHQLDIAQTTKTYYQKRMIDYGRSVIRMRQVSDSRFRRITPTSLMKQVYHILGNVQRWLITRDIRMRFFHKLRVYRGWGELMESAKIMRNN